MKIYLPLLSLSMGTLFLAPMQAQNKAKTKITVGDLEKSPIVIKKPLSVTRRVGEVMRFKLWAEGLPRPNYSNGMKNSAPYKPFGILSLGGETYWNKPKPARSYASSWTKGIDEGMVYQQGQRFEISADSKYTNGRSFDIDVYYTEMSKFKLAFILYHLETDGTGGTNTPQERAREIAEQNDYNYAHPPPMGRFDLSLNLSRKSSYVWAWTDGKMGSKLHMSVQRVSYIYDVNGPQVGPVIKAPILPGRLPCPGPVSDVKRPRVEQKTKVR